MKFSLARIYFARIVRARCSRFGTGILVLISIAALAADANVNLGQDLEAGSTKNFTGMWSLKRFTMFA